MHTTGLPPELHGDWIWDAGSRDKMDSYVLFRREFMVTEAPGTAELWIAAHTDFHLYINGRHFSRAATSACGRNTYAHYFDIGFCMEIGRNVIAVIAHNVNVIRSAREKRPSGLWCQLNLDGMPTLATDSEWLCRPATHYLTPQPRQSPASGFVENADMRLFPTGWADVDFDSTDWHTVDWGQRLANAGYKLIPLPDFEPSNELLPLDFVAVRGNAQPNAATTHVAIPKAVRNADGLYAAETWVNAGAATDIDLQLFCDDPYHLFINDEHIRCQGETPRAVGAWVDPTWNAPRGLMQGPQLPPTVKIQLMEGWNRVLILVQTTQDSNAATFVFPGLPPQTRFNRTTDAFSLPGWTICGPLRVPFVNAQSLPMLHTYQRVNYHGSAPSDHAAQLAGVAFQALEVNVYDIDEPVITDSLTLTSGDYVVLSLPYYTRGCIEFQASGAAGDTVHVVYGDHLVADRVAAHTGEHRCIYTVILNDRPGQPWHAIAPAGMKHVMLYVAHASSTIQIESLGVRRLRPVFRLQTSFTCSDDLLNHIWATSARTVFATWDQNFINSAGQPEGQLLADTMIQSIASLYVAGTPVLSEKALREFAAAQYETGEIPSIAPSDLSVRIFDFGLFWPVWLEAHIRQTDDRQLAEDLAPNLEMLLAFYESVATVDEVLIGNMVPPYVSPCLVDYDTTIDNRGVSTGLNAIYCMALLRARWIFNYLGREDAGLVCLRRASRIAQRLRELAFNAEKGLFCDGWAEGVASKSHSLQANTLALLAGIAEPEQYQPLFSKMFLEYAPFVQIPTNHTAETPFFKYFIAEMAFALNSRDWGIDLVRYYWGQMIQQGADTWWERFSTEQEPPTNATSGRCHGYGVCPAIFIIREIIGIRPTDTGYRQVYFNPLLTAAEWARAQIPTAQGVISVDWAFNEAGELEVVLESNYPLEVIPLLDPGIAETATFHVSESVTLLQQGPPEDDAE